ncbi:hypothetical protein ACFWN5_35295 [Streptomyces sp. NPDC058430]|uniref:hypothetical protein n=1 Tax=Streptomyces sp. NPDC058430 TaxID=3346495 RepID=UPI00365C5A02
MTRGQKGWWSSVLSARERPSHLTMGGEQGRFLREGSVEVVDETGAMRVSRCLWVARCTCRRKRRASQTYGQRRPLLDGDAAAVAVAGNEDGAHKAGADILQALNDVAC